MHKSNTGNIIKNKSIVCFAPERWDAMWRNRHQIMSRLSRTNKVLYIEPEMYSIRSLIGSLKKSLFSKKMKEGRLRNIMNGLWVYQHPSWGFNSRWAVLNQLGGMLRIFAIHHAMRKLQMQSPILWIVDPRFGNMIKKFKENFVCYHVVDNYAASPFHSESIRESLKQADQYMLSVADLVIVTSPFLLEEKRKFNDNVHLVKNAVDYEQFAAAKNSKKVPKDMENISKPIIGYIGAVNEKLDFELLDTIARAKPQWAFVFVGETYSGKPGSQTINFLQTHSPNVFILGRRDIQDVASYIHACDICIMPYRRDDYTNAIDSLKLYEYFACEKPVVATDIPVIREHGEAVYIARNTSEFIYKLEEAMASSGTERRSLQRSIAMNNTWSKRVDQLSVLLNDALIKC